jgi:transglutaminase-like putative cysteine protease
MHRLFPRAAALLGAALLALAPSPAAGDGPAMAPLSETTYEVVQTFEVKDLPEGAQRVRLWTWMPEDRPGQRVLDFRVVEAPEGFRIARDPGYGRLWLHADAAASKETPARFVTAFTLRRTELRGLADATKAGTMTHEHRKTFSRELRLDERHMEVTPGLQKIADELCGMETNPVLQARRIFDFVIEKSDHYSKSGPDPKGKCLGDAMECLEGTGDCCTDQHALFIALARARGIPCRLVFGSRLKMEKEGQEYDPGYRCWPLFYAPGLGWVPVDVSSGDAATGGEADRWFGGLDDRRIEWAEGRDFDLEPRSAVRPDLVIRGYVEVDGKPHKGFARKLKFTRR